MGASLLKYYHHFPTWILLDIQSPPANIRSEAEGSTLHERMSNDKKSGKPEDRRSADRFPIEREVRYRPLSMRKGVDEPGTGKTINMSSTGILFQTDRMLLPGHRLELAVSWPAQLNNTCPLKLVAKAKVVRTVSDTMAAVEILQYEFRTQSKATLSL